MHTYFRVQCKKTVPYEIRGGGDMKILTKSKKVIKKKVIEEPPPHLGEISEADVSRTEKGKAYV